MLLLILKVHGDTGIVVRYRIITWYENKAVRTISSATLHLRL